MLLIFAFHFQHSAGSEKIVLKTHSGVPKTKKRKAIPALGKALRFLLFTEQHALRKYNWVYGIGKKANILVFVHLVRNFSIGVFGGIVRI